MKIETIDWEVTSDDESTICCPICGKVWKTTEDDDPEPDACEHLIFLWGEGGLYPLGKFDEELFKTDYLKTKAKVYRNENEDVDSHPDDGSIFESSPDCDVLGGLKTKAIDTLLELTVSGITCGPVSFTTYFGIKSGKSRRPAKRTPKS